MPYKSAKQRAWMHANEPAIAARWDKKYGGKIDSKLAKRVRKQKKRKRKKKGR